MVLHDCMYVHYLLALVGDYPEFIALAVDVFIGLQHLHELGLVLLTASLLLHEVSIEVLLAE